MNTQKQLSCALSLAAIGMLASAGFAQTTPVAPAMAPASTPAAAAGSAYKLLKTDPVGGTGGSDYVDADADGRRLYIPRGNRVDVYDLDTLASVGSIADAMGVHGAAFDPKSGHGFCSSNPVVMWDTKTLATIKTIPVQGRPDGILFDSATQHVFILSHAAPNLTVIDAKDGTIVGTVDHLGTNDSVGAVEQGATDGKGHLYFDIEDQDCIAVVDANTLKVTNHYDISSKGGGPGGLAMDAKNNILFAACADPATMVIVNATDGKIITSLPIGSGVDAVEFNPGTLEAFSSQRDGTLTVVKENSPANFVVEQTVKTASGAKCSTLDSKTNQILLITNIPGAAPAVAGAPAIPAAATPPAATPAVGATPAPAPGQRGGGRRGGGGGGVFSILVVGKQ